MRPGYLLCDVCGSKIPEENQIHLTVDRQMDGAGSMENVVEHTDLCAKCMWLATRKTFIVDHESAPNLWKTIQGMSRKVK